MGEESLADETANTTCHSLGEVCAKELLTIKDRRKRVGGRLGCAKDKMAPAARSLIGLALSGGGIRSAATNLGVLQGLAKSGIMQLVDYLSTVSGGGYIGSCLSSLLSNICPPGDMPPGNKEKYRFTDDSPALFTTAWESFPFRDDHVNAAAGFASGTSPCGRLTGKEQMEYLRTRANYLAPRPTYLSNSVMRAVGSVTLTCLTPFLWFLLVIVVLTSMYMMVVAGVAPGLSSFATKSQQSPCAFVIDNNGTPQAAPGLMPSLPEQAAKEKDNGKEIMERAKAAWNKIKGYAKTPFVLLREMPWHTWVPTGLAGIAAGIILMLPWSLALRRISQMCGQARGSGEDEESWYDRTHFRGTFILALLALAAVLLFCILKVRAEEKSFANGALLLLPSIFLAGAYLGSGFVFVLISRTRSKRWRREDRATMNMTMGVFVVLLPFTLILAILPGLIMAADAVTVLFVEAPLVLALRWWLGRLRQENDKQTTKRIQAKFTNYLLGLVVPLLVLLAAVGTGSFLVEHWLSAWPVMDANSWQALKWTLGASATVLLIFSALVDVNRVAPHYFYRDRLAETFLRTLAPKRGADERKRDDIEMRLCDLHGSDSDGGRCMGRGPYLLINATLNLTAAFDLKGFNRRSDIFTFARHYVGAEQTGYVPTTKFNKALQLARAMTISGAAFTSVTGVSSSPASSFACTILGVRLGYWLKNPRGSSWIAPARWLQKGLPASFRLAQELLCYTHARGPEIYLSDGGHSGDNLGIMPLLRRRVKIVIASDSECDPKHAFDSFNSSLRQAYVDEGIKIRISLDDLRLDEKRVSKKYYAVGRILYPDRPWQPSWLILLKNTMTAGEIETILNYKQKSPDFPHETTGDQFFTEEQFESYRALGRNAAEAAFTGLGAVPGGLVGPETEKGKEDCNPWLAAEELCRRLAGDQNRTHPWDDVLQALWDAEQEGFQDWRRFKTMMERYAVGMISIARPAEPFVLQSG